MVLISVADGTVRVLKTLGWWPARFSPDGRYIVYSRAPHEGVLEDDIYLFSLADGNETPLVEHPADDSVLDWSPDGNWILFASDRSGTFGVWAIRVVDGKVQGDAQLIKLGMPRILPMGLTRDGSFYYGYGPRSEDIYVAKLDPDTGKIIGQPQNAVQRYEGLSSYPSYSPDGKRLAYVCARGPIVFPVGRSDALRVRSLETGKDREVSTEPARIFAPRWFADGRAILVAGQDDNGTGIYKVDTETGQTKLIVHDAPGISFHYHEASLDGKALFYVRTEREKDVCRILLRDLDSGKEEALYQGRVGENFTLSLSPDGSRLAFFNRNDHRVLRIIPAKGGEPRELLRFEQKGRHIVPMAWTPDGKYILFSKQFNRDEAKWDLWRMPVDGGEPEAMGLGKRFSSLSIHPDGNQIAFHVQRLFNEVWVMENFLPVINAKR
jgi:Tol biopolymer transport system component